VFLDSYHCAEHVAQDGSERDTGGNIVSAIKACPRLRTSQSAAHLSPMIDMMDNYITPPFRAANPVAALPKSWE
jgi:hypothetical protein